MRIMFRTLIGLAAFAARLAAQDVASHVAAGDAARCRRDAADALSHFRAALSLDSLSYEANWKAARALTDVGKGLPDTRRAERDSVYDEARRLAERAVQVKGTGADGHYMTAVAVGRVALTKGPRDRVRYAKVIREEALRALELDARHDGALHVLGRWNAEIQRLPMVSRVVARTFLGASVFSEASWDNAVHAFNEAIAINPLDLQHRLDLGETLVDAGRAPEARAHLEFVVQQAPGCDPQDPRYKEQAAELLGRIIR